MRRIYQNGFGILANGWRVFRKPFMLEPDKVKTITLATITLHNWLREESENGKIYISKSLIDHENTETGEIFEGSWRADDVQRSCYFHVSYVTLLGLVMPLIYMREKVPIKQNESLR